MFRSAWAVSYILFHITPYKLFVALYSRSNFIWRVDWRTGGESCPQWDKEQVIRHTGPTGFLSGRGRGIESSDCQRKGTVWTDVSLPSPWGRNSGSLVVQGQKFSWTIKDGNRSSTTTTTYFSHFVSVMLFCLNLGYQYFLTPRYLWVLPNFSAG